MNIPILNIFDSSGFLLGQKEAQRHPVEKDTFLTDVLNTTLIPLPDAELKINHRWQFKNEEWKQAEEPGVKTPSLDDYKSEKLAKIISETEANILAGFEYEIDDKKLHFSYQYNDQQNFSDTNNMAILSKMGIPGIPEKVTWNGWEIEKDKDGKEISRSLVRLDLTTEAFLGLYTQGALAHKALQMEIGSQRKEKVDEATSIGELEAI